MSRSRVVEVLQICRAIVSNLVSQGRGSVDVLRRGLQRSYELNDLSKAKETITRLAIIDIKESAYNKITAELNVLDTNASLIAKKKLTSEAQQAIDMLNAVSHLDKSKVLRKQLKRLPKPKNKHLVPSHDLCIFFGVGTPLSDEISGLLPKLVSDTGVPMEFLVTASGIRPQGIQSHSTPLLIPPASQPMILEVYPQSVEPECVLFSDQGYMPAPQPPRSNPGFPGGFPRY